MLQIRFWHSRDSCFGGLPEKPFDGSLPALLWRQGQRLIRAYTCKNRQRTCHSADDHERFIRARPLDHTNCERICRNDNRIVFDPER